MNALTQECINILSDAPHLYETETQNEPTVLLTSTQRDMLITVLEKQDRGLENARKEYAMMSAMYRSVSSEYDRVKTALQELFDKHLCEE